ncbi:uncharacterized protein LOC130913856 [Corythoichthys intestinalis]|uniref:uncharacterized protein LOC130913856 n=1 Tax=Corythoichthys intestinalis TaxID=161448 RepID=UPI0025A4EBB4|nr:uncharacterized protein LOC130913856 [Corythoichthys intestinalis]
MCTNHVKQEDYKEKIYRNEENERHGVDVVCKKPWHKADVTEDDLRLEQHESDYHIKQEEGPETPYIKKEQQEDEIRKFPLTVSVKSEQYEVKDQSELSGRAAEPSSRGKHQHLTTRVEGDHCRGSQSDSLIPSTLKNRPETMASEKKRDFFLWTDEEVLLLLKVTNDHKTSMAALNVDWETSQTKYGDILARFINAYPTTVKAGTHSKEFPHKKEEINKGIITTKLKNIRIRYRRAVDSGRRSGHGRVVLLYFDACESIWGASPATVSLNEGVDTNDINSGYHELEVPPTLPSSPTSDSSSMESRKRRLMASDDGQRDHRHKKLRKLTTMSIAQEDLELKRNFFQRQEAMDRAFLQRMDRITTNIERLVDHLTQPRHPIVLSTPRPHPPINMIPQSEACNPSPENVPSTSTAH